MKDQSQLKVRMKQAVTLKVGIGFEPWACGLWALCFVIELFQQMKIKASNVKLECDIKVLPVWFIQSIYKRLIVWSSFLRIYRQKNCNSSRLILDIWTWKNENFKPTFKNWILQTKLTKLLWSISQCGHMNVASIKLRTITTYCQIRIWIGSKPDQSGLQCKW